MPKKSAPKRKANLPTTERDWCHYRTSLSCKLVRDAISREGRAPAGISQLEWAVFHLSHAVEEVANMLKHSNVKSP